MEEMKAMHQWANRPADERFWDLTEMKAAAQRNRVRAATATVPFQELRVLPGPQGQLQLVGKADRPAYLNSWAFSQVCTMAGAPPQFLRKLDFGRAAGTLTYCIRKFGAAADRRLLFRQDNGSLTVRACNGPDFARLWNRDALSWLDGIEARGWRVPPARPAGIEGERTRTATEQDVLAASSFLSVKAGDLIAPAGLYLSDEDLFAFMVNEDARIDDGSGQGLSRAFMLAQSEVGKMSVTIDTFLYRHCCGNHILWGAKRVGTLRLRHRGSLARLAERSQATLFDAIKGHAEGGFREDEARIRELQRKTWADAGEQEGDLFKAGIGRKAVKAGQDAVRPDEDGHPLSRWGIAQGLTRASQENPNADARRAADEAAGRVLEIDF